MTRYDGPMASRKKRATGGSQGRDAPAAKPVKAPQVYIPRSKSVRNAQSSWTTLDWPAMAAPTPDPTAEPRSDWGKNTQSLACTADYPAMPAPIRDRPVGEVNTNTISNAQPNGNVVGVVLKRMKQLDARLEELERKMGL